ncbi:MAG: helix-turn-helix transcriptional regulator [Candidatus Amulumruptor caecigallinarius]|nr:helix-turn-helix transcriptional regulator [Candidatus Amulumruptor caecigallinarius]MCM1397765.1 helix-turn-helix transcriptional regulator [Candidatus Amulumruptor caecigallinarius]MCM1454505.1 helix-turn-helix transcriptional regulator [bacterium]
MAAALHSHTDINNYTHSDRLRDLIDDNPQLLMVLSRFGISLGFGDASVSDVCEKTGVDTRTFLAVANFISHRVADVAGVSAKGMMEYLKRAHSYFLDFILPSIRRKLIEAVNCSGTDEVGILIIKFFDEYYNEVRTHMNFENSTVFVYVENLLQGIADEKYNITLFASHHEHIEARLKELKDIIIRYYPGADNDLINSALYDIISCEDDLATHCSVEDRIFVPVVKTLEHKVARERNSAVARAASDDEEAEADGRMEQLSARERQIVACIAKGLSNKEIAAELNISVNTVTTHRRNISSKLSIHSAAGLTIFAIINKLVDITELTLPTD